MNFREQMLKDLDDVFFNETEFSVQATYTGALGSAEILVCFDEDDDVVFDSSGDLDTDVSASVPVAICKVSDVSDASHGDTLVIDGVIWYIIDMNPPKDGMRKLYLSKDRS